MKRVVGDGEQPERSLLLVDDRNHHNVEVYVGEDRADLGNFGVNGFPGVTRRPLGRQ